RDDGAAGSATFAGSPPSTAGGAPRDLIVSNDPLLHFELLGDGIVTLQRPALPPQKDASIDAGDGDERPRAEQAKGLDEEIALINQTALYRVRDGGAPVRISPEGRRCAAVVGTADGRRVAFSVPPPDSSNLHLSNLLESDVHVLGSEPEEDTRLHIK